MHKCLRVAAMAAMATISTMAAVAGPPAAAEAKPEPEPAAEAAPSSPVLESTRQGVRSTTEWLVRGVDSWFGDKPFSEGGKVTDGRLSLVLLSRQHEKPDFSVRFNARVWLPNLEDRAYLFLGRDDAREAVTDQPDAFSRQQQLPRNNQTTPTFFAGLGLLLLHDTVQVRLGFRGGLKPYAHLRAAKAWRLGESTLVDFRETVFWTVADRLGSTTVLSFEHSPSSTLALRWLTSATITQDSKRFGWDSNLGAYRSFGNQQVLSAELLLNGQEGSGVAVADYGLQLKWEQPVYQDWLLGEFLIGHFWPRPDASSVRTRAWALGASLKMRF